MHGKNAWNMNVRNAGPPANTVKEMTPDKEEQNQPGFDGIGNMTNGVGNGSSSSASSPPPAYKKKKNGGSNGRKASGGGKKTDNQQMGNQELDMDYSAIEDEHHPDFGTNGFLHSDRFAPGSRLPLLSNSVKEAKEVPDLEFVRPIQPLGDMAGRGSHGESRSSTSTTTSGGGRKLSGVIFGSGGGDEFTGGDNPAFEPFPTSGVDNGGTPPVRTQSQFAPMFKQQQKQPPPSGYMYLPDKNHPLHSLFTSSKEENGNDQQMVGNKENNEVEEDKDGNNFGGGGKQLTSNTGTNTINSGANNTNGGGSVRILHANNENSMVPYFLKMPTEPNQRQQQIERQQNMQKAEARRNIQKRKQHSRDKGQIIKPQEQPGYVGDKEVDDIMKTLGFEPDRSPTGSSPSTRGTENNGSTTKKANKKQQKQQKAQQFGGKKQQNVVVAPSAGPMQESYTSPQPEEEDMEVDIELDNDTQGSGDGAAAGIGEPKKEMMIGNGFGIEVIGNAVWTQPPTKVVEVEPREEAKQQLQEKEAANEQQLQQFGHGDWESPVVKKTLAAEKEQKRKLEEEIRKRKEGEEEEGKRREEEKKKRKLLEEEARKKKLVEEEARKKREAQEEEKRRKGGKPSDSGRKEAKQEGGGKQRKDQQPTIVKEENQGGKKAEQPSPRPSPQKPVAPPKTANGTTPPRMPSYSSAAAAAITTPSATQDDVAATKAQQQQKKAWCPPFLAAKKEEWRQIKQNIQQTPLLDRIPPNVLDQLGWRCPITIVNPAFQTANGNGRAPTMNKKERMAVWTGPADKWLEQKPPQRQPNKREEEEKGGM